MGGLDAGHHGADAGIHLTDRDIHDRAAGGYPELACGKHRQDQTRPVRRTSRRPGSRHVPTPVHPGRINSSRRVIDRPPRLLNGLEVNDGSLLAQGVRRPFFRAADYADMAGKMKPERSEYLASFDGLAPSILKSIAQLHRKRIADRNGLRHVRANAIPVAPLFAGRSGSLDTFSIASLGTFSIAEQG